MPGISGMEVLAQIKQLDPNARVVIGTADIQDASLQAAENLGASGYIRKPFTSAGVREAIQSALRG
jgi:two-component system, chemotaxis family, chemotaxis protein CheY